MIAEIVMDFISPQRNRPLSVAVAVAALFAPSSLIIFLSKPELYAVMGLNGVLLLSVTISLPILLLCYSIWYTPLAVLLKTHRLVQGEPADETDFEQALAGEDLLEWPCVLAAGWSSNLLLFGIAAFSYFHPLRIGATYLLLAAILLAVWLLALLASMAFYVWAADQLQSRKREQDQTGAEPSMRDGV